MKRHSFEGDKVTQDLKGDVDKMVSITDEGKKKSIKEKDQYANMHAACQTCASWCLSRHMAQDAWLCLCCAALLG